jgi:hypothetical protein
MPFPTQTTAKPLNAGVAQPDMYAQHSAPDDSPPIAEPLAANAEGLEELLHLRSSILKAKLQVLAAELLQRIQLRDQNAARVDAEKTRVLEVLPQLSRQARYHLREPRDNATFYQQAARLDEERRSQDTQCWQDIARAMHDFLDVWEAHQQATVRGRFLQNAG